MRTKMKSQSARRKATKAKRKGSAVVRKATRRPAGGGDVYVTRSRVKPVELGSGSQLKKMAEELSLL